MTFDPIADYYNRKAAEAKALYEELAKAKAEGRPTEEIERQLELALYVGD